MGGALRPTHEDARSTARSIAQLRSAEHFTQHQIAQLFGPSPHESPVSLSISSLIPRALRGARRHAALLAVTVVALLARATDAEAHGALKSSTPKSGAALDTVPKDIRLEFSESVVLRQTKIVLIGPNGTPVALNALAFGDDKQKVVVATPAVSLAAGGYEVRWQTAGADGHPTRGRFPFTIRPNAVRKSVAPTSTDASQLRPNNHQQEMAPRDEELFDERSPTYVAIRWLQYISTFLVVGAFVFSRLVLARAMPPEGGDAQLLSVTRNRTLRLGFLASAFLLVVQAARFLAQRAALRGGGDFMMDVSIADLVIGTAWGTGWLLVVVGAVLACVHFRMALTSRRNIVATLVVALALVATGLGMSGHQAASPIGTALGVSIDAVHVLATAGWLGTLAVLVLTGAPAIGAATEEDHLHVAAILRRFSPVVLVAAAIAAASGLALAIVNIGTPSALWQADYGRLLLAKLAVLSAVAATGAFNWRRVLPSLGTAAATRALRQSATLEAVIAVAVVGLTAVLVATPTPVMQQ